MAKIVKSDRELPNIDLEVAKVSKTKKETKKNNKKESTKKSVKKEKVGFIGEVRKEMSKVVWPSRKNLVKYSIAAIAFIIFFSLFFYVIELIMALLKAGV